MRFWYRVFPLCALLSIVPRHNVRTSGTDFFYSAFALIGGEKGGGGVACKTVRNSDIINGGVVIARERKPRFFIERWKVRDIKISFMCFAVVALHPFHRRFNSPVAVL